MSATTPRAGTPSATRASRRYGTITHRSSTGLLLVLPALAFIVVFVLVPFVFAIGISFTNWPLVGAFRFIGLENFAAIPGDTAFWKAVGYTLLYTAIVTGPILLVGYLMAVVVRANRRGSTVLRTLFFLPYVIGLSTLSFLLVLEAQPGSGAVNLVLQGLGITDGQTAWFTSGPLATVLISLLVVWGVSGLTMVLLLAGMQAVPREVHESAEVDGATWWQRERSITLPMLRRPIAMSLILSVIGSFLAFSQFFILTQGGPGTDTTPVVLAIYNRAFVQLQVGSATALSLVLVLVVALVTAAQFWLLREKD
ncbi:carbohydrate ABC transporter permease [Quadrisphaera sp. INWT6]|uniref:carbohydrate ABC transporter permease n=1 Tax=Quadrisphaera sp. INWT6 TaxID=2596917 RepID=UPI0018921969|nr:sugar ABC transporter permease [Quadrisphaera sp. INWT6]MBF5082994.1 sugar ABC transporter permease [Quadrisphaera sp. INWT6]